MLALTISNLTLRRRCRARDLGKQHRLSSFHHWLCCGPCQRLEVSLSLLQKRWWGFSHSLCEHVSSWCSSTLLHGAHLGSVSSSRSNIRLEDQPNIQGCWILCRLHCIFCLLLLQRHNWLGLPLPLLIFLLATSMEGSQLYQLQSQQCCLPGLHERVEHRVLCNQMYQ